MAGLHAGAPDSLVLDYAALTFEQAEALRGGKATGCLRVLFPTNEPGSLPPAFVARKERVLGRILRSHDTPIRAATWKSGGRAAVREAWSHLSPAQREALAAPEIGLAYPVRVCDAGIAIAHALGALPPAERAQSLRALFGTGEALLRPDWDITVQEIVVGRSKGTGQSVIEPITRFGFHDTFFVFVTTAGGVEPVTIGARWTYQAAELLFKENRTITPSGHVTTSFGVLNAGGWRAGRYKVEITLDGKRVGSRTFEVPPWGQQP